MSTEPRHVVAPSANPKDTVEWLEWHGYRCALVHPQRFDDEVPQEGGQPFVVTSFVGRPGVLFGRKNQPLVLAQVGDVLIWNGTNVVIEE